MILRPPVATPSKRKPSIKMIGAIYARYSSRFQHSIEDQIRVCKDWAEKNGIEVPDDLIFLDRAVTGKSSRRQGLKDFQKALAENRAGVAILFTTNRLYRKFYQSLAFVEEEIVDKGKRAVFVKSGPIDTDDKEHWRKLLHIHALMDEFVIQTIAAHVQSAHEGLLLQCRVFGTVAFGFTGEEIAGQLTRLGPAGQTVDHRHRGGRMGQERSYDLFVSGALHDPRDCPAAKRRRAPLPPRSPLQPLDPFGRPPPLVQPPLSGVVGVRADSSRFGSTSLATPVSRNVTNPWPVSRSSRYGSSTIRCGVRHRSGWRRWPRMAGGRPADGDRRSRPRVLNGLIHCHKHKHVLYVHGPYGKYMSCKACREEAEPELYSFLPRRLSLDLVCDRLAELMQDDQPLVDQAKKSFRQHVENLTQPDMSRAETLARRSSARLARSTSFWMLQEIPNRTRRRTGNGWGDCEPNGPPINRVG